ncbi:MAG TPA: bifunctional YncE family protein/alkaline phosphatase family protein [Cyclobacteriaceae bacterium]|jgi:YVTN family beta-propeller protein|nr:bifunctional YncE family protein/alkaline phosphatase family protein [Cyclobacteriaceae bacterium]
MRKIIFLVVVIVGLYSCNKKPNDSVWEISAPAGKQFTHIDYNGTTVIPNGRLLTPYGKQVLLAPHPFGLVVSPDGKTVITSNSGTGPFSISIVENPSTNCSVTQIPETGAKESPFKSVFMGLAISPDNSKAYVAGGQDNKVYVFDLKTKKMVNEIPCNKSFDKGDYSDGYLGDMVLTKDGSTLFVADQIGFRIVVIDTKSNRVVDNVKTGRYPFCLALSPDEKKLYVSNIGMFEYSYLKSIDKKRLNETAAKYPAYAFNSKEMKEGIKNDSIEAEGLGDPNVPASFSVWAYDVNGSKLEVKAKIKTGVLVGEMKEDIETVGGSSPNSIVASENYIFVSNGNNDNISVIDTREMKIVKEISLQLDPRLGNKKGVIPFGLTLSPDQRTLFVAEAGINAVGVIDVATAQVKGHIPSGWFPSRIVASIDGKKLFVTNAKGFGSGPNGGRNFVDGPEGHYIGALMKGTLSVMDIPSDHELKQLTQKVIDNNFVFTQTENLRGTNPIPFTMDEKSPIKYIVFISKENRTYDEIFGQLKNGSGDETLARYGDRARVVSGDKKRVVENVTVMPNHLALAEQFTISDNFYVDADVSADGHKWLANTYPNEWIETQHPASYGGERNQKQESKAPGKFAMTGAAGAIFPEDYNQHGSLWDHLYRNRKEFYNFGFGVEFDAGSFSDSTFKYGGVRYLVNYPTPGPLYDRTSRLFPTFNMAIPDQFRADIFIKEIKERYLDKKLELPSMLTLQLLNDHGAGERLHAGFGFHHSYMADNDLAVGRVVEFLSHTEYWKNMLIVITEDDAQGGRDHVDAHRSILMLISPYVKKNNVDHTHASFGSIFKTFWKILSVPSLNHYDDGATSLRECFTSTPDFTPYNALPVDKRIFDPVKALTPLHEKFDWEAVFNSPKLDDPDDMKRGVDEDDDD